MDLYTLDRGRAFLISQKALIIEANKLLVLESMPDHTSGQSSWELPGGLLESDESLPDGLLREVREETGLLVAIGHMTAIWDHWTPGFKFRDGRVLDVRMIGIAFLCQRIGGDVQLSREHRRFGWMANHELRQLQFSQNSKFAVEKYLSENGI